MRKIAILCLLLVGALPALAGSYRPDEIPNVQRMDRRRYVSNPDGILSAGAVARIDSLCASLRERGLAQVAVVAVDDIAGGDAFSFAVELFRSWGVGSAESDNGLGILLVKELREIRFVTGGGLEGILPDALCKRIQLNYMLPAFREGNYSAGMVAGVGAAATILEGGEVDLGGDADEDLPAWMIFTIVFGFVIFPLGMVLANYYFSRRCPKCRKLTLKQQSQQVLSVTRNYRLVEYTYVCPNCGAVVKRRSRNLRDDNFGGGAGGGTIIGGGFDAVEALQKVASEFPEQRYLFVDGEVTGCDNVTSVLFKDNEKTYLVGTVAGLNTKTNKIGMVVGVDRPSQNIFVAGYMAGAKAANPDVEVIVKYVGSFADTTTAKELALAEADAGADVIFAAAGGSGLGVFNAAQQGTFKAIGADVNQCLIDPDHIMLSAIRKIDVVIKDGIKSAIDGTLEGGTMVPGLKEDALGITNEGSKVEIDPASLDAAQTAKDKIISGEITVPSTIDEVK